MSDSVAYRCVVLAFIFMLRHAQAPVDDVANEASTTCCRLLFAAGMSCRIQLHTGLSFLRTYIYIYILQYALARTGTGIRIIRVAGIGIHVPAPPQTAAYGVLTGKVSCYVHVAAIVSNCCERLIPFVRFRFLSFGGVCDINSAVPFLGRSLPRRALWPCCAAQSGAAPLLN